MIFNSLSINTNNIEKQKKFYSEILNFQIVEETNESLKIKCGYTDILFIQSEKFSPYHFAFNIPSFMENNALSWLKERTKVLPIEGQEVYVNNDWNAESIYFYDQDKNIVEFIARKNLNIESQSSFNSNCILGLSEIGIPTENIKAIYQIITNKFICPIYDGSFERFCAVGNEEGLFVIVDKMKKKWIPNYDEAYSSEFYLSMETNGKKYQIDFINSKLEIQLLI